MVDKKNLLELKYPMKNCFVPLAKKIMNKGNPKILDTVEKHLKDRFTKYSSQLNC